MVKDVKFCQYVDLYPAGFLASGTITVTDESDDITGVGTLFETEFTGAETLYTDKMIEIGQFDSPTSQTVASLQANATFSYTGRFFVAFKPGGNSNKVRLEGSEITVGFDEQRNDFTLIDGTLLQDVEYYRFVLGVSSPYLRGTGEFVDILNSDSVVAHIPQYESLAYQVVRGSSGIEISTRRQAVIPSIDYTFRSIHTSQTIPDWMKFTKSKIL
jgi:hypothetical protein